mmetsp:Transcript_11723/g.27797  ORF Transcript_11723/g.27797 Transcript_11723/m.27797 type:complete len:211 (-) Transcript_11723:1660-2292(-)
MEIDHTLLPDDVVHQIVLLPVPADDARARQVDLAHDERFEAGDWAAGIHDDDAIPDVVGTHHQNIDDAADCFVGKPAEHKSSGEDGGGERHHPLLQLHAPVHQKNTRHREESPPRADQECAHVVVQRVVGVRGGADVALFFVSALRGCDKFGFGDVLGAKKSAHLLYQLPARAAVAALLRVEPGRVEHALPEPLAWDSARTRSVGSSRLR